MVSAYATMIEPRPIELQFPDFAIPHEESTLQTIFAAVSDNFLRMHHKREHVFKARVETSRTNRVAFFDRETNRRFFFRRLSCSRPIYRVRWRHYPAFLLHLQQTLDNGVVPYAR